jgi:hypothetical protein
LTVKRFARGEYAIHVHARTPVKETARTIPSDAGAVAILEQPSALFKDMI